MIGTLLNIPSGSLEAIECDNPRVCEALLAVFTLWRNTMHSPYSWNTVLKVLATDTVGHRILADDIVHRLKGEATGTVYVLCVEGA